MTGYPTTELGSWASLVPREGITPESGVLEALGGHEDDYDLDGLLDAYRDAINAALPDRITLAGDQFYGPALAGDRDWDGAPDLPDIATAVEGADFWALAAQFERQPEADRPTLRPVAVWCYAIEASDTGHWRPCVAEADRTGTGAWNGSADGYAAKQLACYLADVARDARVRPGVPGSMPCTPLRVIVWRGAEPLTLGQAAAVLYHPDVAHDKDGHPLTVGDRVAYYNRSQPCQGTVTEIQPSRPGCVNHRHMTVTCADGTVSQVATNAVQVQPSGARS